jgi:hypothetical protein
VHRMLQVCHPSSNRLTGVAAVGDWEPTSLAKLYDHIQHAGLGTFSRPQIPTPSRCPHVALSVRLRHGRLGGPRIEI